MSDWCMQALLFGLVPAGNGKKLQKEYNVEQVPCLKVVTKETKPITFEGHACTYPS